MRTLAARYEKTRHPELTMKIYVGGRHEMLNETNRDEFTNDVLRWIAESLSNHQT
jgi:alpha-beta hydrolase superfamily lysophospholipase